MPIYEYRCLDCSRVFGTLILSKADSEAVSCPSCKGKNLKRLISRTFFHRSEADRLSEYDPQSRQPDSFYKDTRNIGLHAKKRAKDMGIELGESFEAKLDRLRTDPGSVLDDY